MLLTQSFQHFFYRMLSETNKIFCNQPNIYFVLLRPCSFLKVFQFPSLILVIFHSFWHLALKYHDFFLKHVPAAETRKWEKIWYIKKAFRNKMDQIQKLCRLSCLPLISTNKLICFYVASSRASIHLYLSQNIKI